MRNLIYHTFLLLFGTLSCLTGQKQVDLMLKSTGIVGQSGCFDILLRSPEGSKINLAGQNYRIFYDAGKLGFLMDKITRHLDKEAYSKIDIINTEDNNIGFLSLSIDGKALTEKVFVLPRDASWKNTLNICFERRADQPFDITWANSKKTALFATAEVAMSEWIDEDKQQILLPNEIYDFSSLDELAVTNNLVGINIYPNPVADYINIEFEGSVLDNALIIKDVIGREVVNESLSSDDKVHYNLNNWPAGVYTVLVLDRKGRKIASRNIVKINK